uniref:PPM-type phosphatase domain-containing protein n=1 Tax=Ditylenchus dipsaci TaxID=166011 RepID=A0A915E5I2_9BILA
MKLSKWLQFRLDRRALTAAVRNKISTDNLLRANERSIVLDDGAISRIDVSQLGANRPVEDFFSASKCLSSNAYFLGVFDGHAGAACSRHVSTRLYDYLSAAILPKHKVVDIATLADRLQWTFSNADQKLPPVIMDSHEQNVRKFYEKFRSNTAFTTVRKAMQAAFVQLDEDLSSGAMPDSHGKVCRMSVNVAASGSCALVSHIRGNNLHVANIGDSEAVLELQRVVLEPLGVPAPRDLHTPPYLTAQPEVLYHRLTPNDKFLILATDGLWDFLDPDTVVRLINDHTFGTQTLSDYEPSGNTLAEVLKDLERRKKGETKKPLDENSATHVIRNALGGCSGGTELQYARLQESLELPPGTARHFRDDITVIVIHFNEHYLIEKHLAAELGSSQTMS